MPAMDLTTYAGLQSAIADFLNRTDLTNEIPGFIALAEANIARDAKIRSKTNSAVALASATVALPTDVRELKSIKLVSASPSQDAPLEIVTPQTLADHATQWTTAGRPRYASLVGSTLHLVPAPDQTYTAEITYTPKLTPLSGTNATNEVLADAPDAYLYGALSAGAMFLEHDDRAPTWDTAYQRAITQLNIMRTREEMGAAPLVMRLPVRLG